MRRSESSERKAARTRRAINHVAKQPSGLTLLGTLLAIGYAFGRLRR